MEPAEAALVARYREQVAAVLDAVRLSGPLRYTWLGHRNPLAPLKVRRDVTPDEARVLLAQELRDELYDSFYCRGGVTPSRTREPRPVGAEPRHVAAITAANHGRGGANLSWRVERVGGEGAVVSDGMVRMRVPAASVAAGATVGLPRPAQLTALSPGFVTLLGDAGDERGDGVVRVYWNIVPTGVPVLASRLTSWLNDRGTRFRLKVLDHPLLFDRCDAAVLYLPAGEFGALRPGLTAIGHELAPVLRRSVPAFTLALAGGIAAAEHDGGPVSFGELRCAWLADAIVGGVGSVDDIAARFAHAGVDLDAPYREPALAGRHVL